MKDLKDKHAIKNAPYSVFKKKLPKGKYKYVYSYQMLDNTIIYQAYISKYRWSVHFLSEKEAAKAVDLFLINKGLPPINVLSKTK